MLRLKTLISVALVAAASTLALGGKAYSQTVVVVGGEGGVSGAAAFFADPETGNVTAGAVAGAVGRTYAITDAYVDAETAGSYGIGTSLVGFLYESDGYGNIYYFNSAAGGSLPTDEGGIIGSLQSFIDAQNDTYLGYPLGLVASPDGLELF